MAVITMKVNNSSADLPAAGGTAPLRNITLAMGLMQKLLDRPPHLPGIGVLSGFSGLGKSVAAAAVAANFQGYYVEMRSTWTRKALLLAILRQMGVQPAKTIPELVDQIAEQLVLSGRPLLIDEMDHVVDRNLVELVRDLYESSQAPLMVIGEELLPHKLVKWERFHGRVLDWVQAQPCDRSDAGALARLYCRGVEVADDLLDFLVAKTHGSTRRVAVNLERVREFAHGAGLKRITRSDWGDRPVFTGEPPKTRRW